MAAHQDFDFLRDRVQSAEDLATLDQIRADRELLLVGGSLARPGAYLTLRLSLPAPPPTTAERPVTLVLRRDLAPASIDAVLEVFRDDAHMRIPGFRSESEGTVVDVGAHEGFYALRLALTHPRRRIVAAEPLPEHVELMRRSLQAMDVRTVEPFETGIAEAAGQMVLECYPHVGTVTSRDLMAFPRPWIKRELIERRTVTAETLRGFLDRVGIDSAGILKMDIEGAESAVLAGDPELLRRFDRIVVECHGEESRHACLSALEAADFRCVHAEARRSGDLYFERLD